MKIQKIKNGNYYKMTAREVAEHQVIGKSEPLYTGERTEDLEWAMGDLSLSDCKDMFFKGQPHPSVDQKIKEASNSGRNKGYNEKYQSARRRRRKNEFEGDICIDTYMSGDSAYYRQVTKVKAQDRMINVVINVSAHSGNSEEFLFEAYSEIISNIEKLLMQGYMVQVMAVAVKQNTFNEKSDDVFAIVLKEDNKPIDKGRLKIIAHTSFYRVFMFNAYHYANTKDSSKNGLNWGYGQPINTQQYEDKLQGMLTELSNVENKSFRYYDAFNTSGMEFKNGKLIKE